MENDHNNSTLFNPQEMLSPFDAIKETDGEGVSGGTRVSWHGCWAIRNTGISND